MSKAIKADENFKPLGNKASHSNMWSLDSRGDLDSRTMLKYKPWCPRNWPRIGCFGILRNSNLKFQKELACKRMHFDIEVQALRSKPETWSGPSDQTHGSPQACWHSCERDNYIWCCPSGETCDFRVCFPWSWQRTSNKGFHGLRLCRPTSLMHAWKLSIQRTTLHCVNRLLWWCVSGVSGFQGNRGLSLLPPEGSICTCRVPISDYALCYIVFCRKTGVKCR